MAEATRKKAIDYLRAVWVDEDQSETLQEILAEALKNLSSPADSIFDCGDGTFEATTSLSPVATISESNDLAMSRCPRGLWAFSPA